MVNFTFKKIILLIIILIGTTLALFFYVNHNNVYNLKNIRNYTYEDIWKGTVKSKKWKLDVKFFLNNSIKNYYTKFLLNQGEWKLISLSNNAGVNLLNKKNEYDFTTPYFIKFIDSSDVQKIAGKFQKFEPYYSSYTGRYYFLEGNEICYTGNQQNYYGMKIIKLNRKRFIYRELTEYSYKEIELPGDKVTKREYLIYEYINIK